MKRCYAIKSHYAVYALPYVLMFFCLKSCAFEESRKAFGLTPKLHNSLTPQKNISFLN